jgi:putative ABC transport system substrate-binding protein
MQRRDFIAGLGSTAAWPVVALAQQAKMPVIGWLSPVPGTRERYLPAFSQGLAETGYVVGRNVTIDASEDVVGRQAALADFVRRQVTVIAAVGAQSALAAKAATQTIPVVFVMVYDPVEFGVVASLNRPSGNLTGVTRVGVELGGKRLEMLHKLVPAADSIAYLMRRVASADDIALANVQTAARLLGVRLLPLAAATESEIAAAFATIVEQHAAALISSGAFSPAAVDQIISLAGRYAVPTLYFTRADVAGGGLASYGVSEGDSLHQMGVYTGRILKGEKPADLPVMQPTKFEFVINLKTAKLLGIEVPETLLATADEVIQKADVHRGAREHGGVASRGEGAAVPGAGDRVSQPPIR